MKECSLRSELLYDYNKDCFLYWWIISSTPGQTKAWRFLVLQEDTAIKNNRKIRNKTTWEATKSTNITNLEFLYQFGEAVTAGVADPLRRGGAVQPKWSSDARLGPGGTDGIFDGIENGCRQEKRGLSHRLAKKQWWETSHFLCEGSSVTVVLPWRRRWPYHWEHLGAMRHWAPLERCQRLGSCRNLDPEWGGLPEGNNGAPLGWRGPDPARSPPQPASREGTVTRHR